LSFDEFDFLRIYKLLVNTNIDGVVNTQNYDDIYREKQVTTQVDRLNQTSLPATPRQGAEDC